MAINVRSEITSFIKHYAQFFLDKAECEWKPGKRSDGIETTVLVVRDRIPKPRYLPETPRRLQITSEHHRLRKGDFGWPASKINRVGAKGHGRTLTCLDANDEPLAAIAFHLDKDPSAPLYVTAIAVLEPHFPPKLRELSRVLAGVLLCYLVYAAEVLGHPGRLAFDPDRASQGLADKLGFRPTHPPRAYAEAGENYCEWQPPRRLTPPVP